MSERVDRESVVQITKVKFQRGTILVQAHDELPAQQVSRDMTIKSEAEARPEFGRALVKLGSAALKEVQAPAVWHSCFECIGASFSWRADDGAMGVTATMLVTLDRFAAPLVINTPHKCEQGDRDGNEPFLEGEFLQAALDVMSEAQLYAKGLRAQIDLEDILSQPDPETGEIR